MAKLKLGIDLHNRASVFMPQQGIDYDLNRLIDLAVLCEELGFYSVSVGDSLLSKPRWRAIPTDVNRDAIRLGALLHNSSTGVLPAPPE